MEGAVDTQQEIGSGVEKDVCLVESQTGAQIFMICRPWELDGNLVPTIGTLMPSWPLQLHGLW